VPETAFWTHETRWEADVDEDIMNVARMIRPYLPALVGDETDEYDREIAGLLARARDGDDVSDQLLAVLTRSKATHAWAARVLESGRQLPPEVSQTLERGYQQLLGDGGVIGAEKFECPCGDYAWYRISVGVTVPRCPTHPECPLVAA
jgi:hypothetical protein